MHHTASRRAAAVGVLLSYDSEILSVSLRAKLVASPTCHVQFHVLPKTSSSGKWLQSILVSKLTAVTKQALKDKHSEACHLFSRHRVATMQALH